eukprot:653497-Amphidinium_carterae.1
MTSCVRDNPSTARQPKRAKCALNLQGSDTVCAAIAGPLCIPNGGPPGRKRSTMLASEGHAPAFSHWLELACFQWAHM